MKAISLLYSECIFQNMQVTAVRMIISLLISNIQSSFINFHRRESNKFTHFMFPFRLTYPSKPSSQYKFDGFKHFFTQFSCLVNTGGDYIECNWSGFVEKESEIAKYMFGVGKAEGDDSIYPFVTIGPGIRSHRATGRFTVGIGDGLLC